MMAWLRQCVLFMALWASASAFLTNRPGQATSMRTLTATLAPQDDTQYSLSMDDIKPILKIGSDDKEKVINAFGLWCAAVSVVTSPIWIAAMSFVNMINDMNPEWDPVKAIHDKTGKIWAHTWLTLTRSYPTFSGNVQRLKEGHGPCLYVANHASWLDIPVLCTVLDPVFKFIAKGELRKVPCIGQQLVGGDHILIDREDRRSQLRTFKDGLSWLRKGVPLMAFPEGMRSPDGRLMDFKGGLFSMAVKANVPIVPISLAHTHAVMPCNSFFPVQSGAGKLHVHVHDAIDTADKSEEELATAVRAALLSQLPSYQHPIAAETVTEAKEIEATPKKETVAQ